MNKYELVYIVDAHAPQHTKDEIARQVSDALAKAEIKTVNTQVWLDRHKMTFPINKIWEGTYYLLNLETKGLSLAKLHGMLRLNEGILRFITIKVGA
ncbi:MAG: 30S ribosomal protein S6 [Candidatus Omnitrophica bacterium]|nr:30S ribosomal protein S6 [Candidatus Omnitrophota bacterium]